jgi:hypothetical protein
MTVTQNVPGRRGNDRDGAETDFVSNTPSLNSVATFVGTDIFHSSSH